MSFRTIITSAVLVAAAATFCIGPAALAGTPGATQVPGTKLANALLTARQFGAGFARVGHLLTSGSGLKPFTVLSVAHQSCARFGELYDLDGYGETAWALTTIGSYAQAEYYTQTLYQFARPGATAAFFNAEKAKFQRCRSFVSATPGVTMHVTEHVSVTRVAGHQAFLVTESDTFAGVSGSAVRYVLVTIDGADVFMAEGDNPSNAVPTNPSLQAVTVKVFARVSALR